MTTSDHILRIDYIEFATRDMIAAKTFLSAAFGWSFTDYGPEYSSFSDGRLSGGLRPDPTSPTPAAPPAVSSSNPLVILFSANLEAALARVSAAAGVITVAPFEFPGGRRFEFTAPGGLAFAVWSDRRADGSKIA